MRKTKWQALWCLLMADNFFLLTDKRAVCIYPEKGYTGIIKTFSETMLKLVEPKGVSNDQASADKDGSKV